MSEYYKSLISDEEVIKELMKESKRREGKLPTEPTRLKPNLNFFQRTVNNLISGNNRIDKLQDTPKRAYLKDYDVDKALKLDSPLKKTKVDYDSEKRLVLEKKINFVKSSEFSFEKNLVKNKKKIEIKKIDFIGEQSFSRKRYDGIHAKQGIADSLEKTEELNIIIMSSSEDEKTTCKSISSQNKISRTCTEADNSNITYISSDDSSYKSTNDKVLKKKIEKTKRKKKISDDGNKQKKIKNKKHKNKYKNS